MVFNATVNNISVISWQSVFIRPSLRRDVLWYTCHALT